MIYVKSIVSGVIGAILAAVLMLVLEVAAFALLAFWQRRSQEGGAGGFSVMFPGIPVLVFAAAGFVFGFWWTYRKRAA
jgi:hypothetical protein